MRLYSIFIQYFLFIYFCYCHDLNHADPITIKPVESSVPIDSIDKTLETTNIQKNHDTIEARFRSTHDLRKPIQESKQNDQQQVQSTITSTDKPKHTELPLNTNAINDNIQTQINSQSKDIIQQNHLQEPLSSTQSHQQEQIKTVSNNISSSSNIQQLNSNTIENSNTNDIKLTEHSQIPLKSPDTIVNDTLIVQNESHNSPSKNTRSTTAKSYKKSHKHPRHVQTDQQKIDNNPTADTNQSENAITQESTNENKQSIESLKSEGLSIEKSQQPSSSSSDIIVENEIQTKMNEENLKSTNTVEHSRQVHTHDSIPILDQSNTSSKKENSSDKNENSTTISNSHLPRIHGNDENKTNDIIKNNSQLNNNETNQSVNRIESKIINVNKMLTNKNRQICWYLPKTFGPSIELLENQIFNLINILPEYVQTIFFGRIDDREILMNTIWFSSICTMCFFFSVLFLSMGTKRLKQTKNEKEIRTRCQQLQQYNNQIELERATFERQNQKLSDEIDELKNLPVRDLDEEIFTLRKECSQFQEDLKLINIERDSLQQDIDHKQNLIQKYENDMQRQTETVTFLNNEIHQLKQELEKERRAIIRLQSGDISLERFEKSQELIQELKSEITQLKQDKFTQKDQLKEFQEHINQLNVENTQLIHRMKQLKTLLEQRNQTIKDIHNNLNEEQTTDLFSILKENSFDDNENLLLTIDNDIEKSNQHIHNLHNEINEKTNRIKELELLLKQEKDHCKEIETKLKVVLELRERDAHLHIRQLGQTDAELRKARTDTERVRILQQQLELKQQQLDDTQKVLSIEQVKFNEETSKLQHETHEKWMEVKRLTRELDVSKKECESLRKQITKYANNERSSQEKMMIKPVLQHIGNNNESETNGSSPVSYQQGENFRPIDHQRNDSGTVSPAEMLVPRPPLFGLSRPPFFPRPFMPAPPPNPFMLHPRFPMPTNGLHGMISPISHLMTNVNDTHSPEILDRSNTTPNSTNYDIQSNGAALSPISNDEKQIKEKKAKKSLKKKTRTSVTSIVKEDV